VPAVTFEQVAEHIRATVPVRVAELTPETTIRDLALDSMLLVEMVVDLQEEFDVMLSQAELSRINTLGELVEALRSQ
jgi:acyl carrier protein